MTDLLLSVGTEIAAQWSEILGCPVGIDDDYRDLGGNSISALRMVAKLRERWRAPVTIADLIGAVTPRAVAALVATHVAGDA